METHTAMASGPKTRPSRRPAYMRTETNLPSLNASVNRERARLRSAWAKPKSSGSSGRTDVWGQTGSASQINRAMRGSNQARAAIRRATGG